jgi:uncharacterized protein YqiB (DUF1249 family)
MRIKDEILRAIKHIVAFDTSPEVQNTEEQRTKTLNETYEKLINKEYDFLQLDTIIRRQGQKKRKVRYYKDKYSAENILCQTIKRILDRVFKIKYPNRNKTIHTLFDTMRAAIQMSDFTIVKYDFKDYFNSVSAEYVYKKFIEPKLDDRETAELISNFMLQTKYAYAGLATSNVVAEIIAKEFDIAMKTALHNSGLIFFERYIDDSFLVFNKYINADVFRSVLNDTLNSVFYDSTIDVISKCKTSFNESKFAYVTNREIDSNEVTVEYLGYSFVFSKSRNKTEIKYGIAADKQHKYEKRVKALINLYKQPSKNNGEQNPDYGNISLLQKRIEAFTSRTVYQSKRYKTNIWKVKGFIENYSELRYLLDTDKIESSTKEFLKNMVEFSFENEPPYFISGSKNQVGFNLFYNMENNKTLLFVENIGYSHNSLTKLCSDIGIRTKDEKGRRLSYSHLVRDYLIKLKVGY